MARAKKLGFWSVTAIGVGGMVGGGIFAVLGLAVQLAGGATPIAFALAGAVALITAYSYARLSGSCCSRAGTVAFLDDAFGPGFFTGSLNVLLWLGYIVTLSLYAYAFGSYGASLLGGGYLVLKHILITAIVVVMTALNLMGANAVGKAELGIVALKVGILLVFIGVGVWGVEAARLAPATWPAPRQLLAGGMVIFVAYEGFQLMANAAPDVREPERTLARAYFAAVAFVIFLYVAIAVVAVGNLAQADIVAAKDYALAVAAEPFLGKSGYFLVAVAALASTASALNATLYGVTRVSYVIAKDGELPAALTKKVWKRPVEGLFISAALTLVFANLFDLSRIAVMGSACFLIIFAAVNAASLRVCGRTRANAALAVLGVALCLLALAALIWETVRLEPGTIWVLVAMVGAAAALEAAYRWGAGRRIRLERRR